MIKRVFKGGLSPVGIDSIIKQLNDYKKELTGQCEMFVSKLAEYGIEVAKQNLSPGYKTYITFTTKVEPNSDGCTAIMLATETGQIHAEWQQKDGSVSSADVSPLLMAEYGSGQYAVDGWRGTFPGQTHAFENAWHWKDLEGNWHHSSGVHPTQPMFNAELQMYLHIKEVADEVFV